MEAICVRYTDLPGTSKLFADVVYDFPKAARFYSKSEPREDYPDSRRAALVSALLDLNGESPALDLLAKTGAVAVVTGQQVGLFGGPCYTVYKALTAIKLARRLTDSGTPAVPVFWLATEDHDFEEVRHAWMFNSSHEPVQVSVATEAGQRPVGGISIASYPLVELRRALNGFPFADEAMRLAGSAYTPGASLGTAFLALLKDLFKSYGLLFIDPLAPGVRTIAAPLLQSAVDAGPDLVRRLLERNRELAEAGYHAQVHVEDGSSLFFVLEGGRRLSLGKDQPIPPPEKLSPNALLRPVMQDYLLPTIAYIGGPAEIAYLAQSQVLYQALGVRPPVARPRSGFTLLDSRAAKLMQRYGLDLTSFSKEEESLKQTIAERLIPPGLASEFQKTTELLATNLDALRSHVLGFDPTLASALDKAQAKMLYQLSKTAAKVRREALRRDETASNDAAYLRNLLYPHRHLQERFYGFLPFIAKHGTDLLGSVYESLNLDCPDHLILKV